MADPVVTTPVTGQGTTFTIGGTTITDLLSTPDLGAPPENIDVTSFDQTTAKRYIPGLQDVSSLSFEFFVNGSNFTTAKGAEPQQGSTATYVVTFPGSIVCTIVGSHRTFISGMGQNEGLKFKVEISVSSIAYS